MPHLQILTNLPSKKIPPDFVTKTVDVIAKIIGKPKGYCVVSVIPDTMMSWGGGTDPCVIVKLMSIGQISEKQNINYAGVLSEHIEKSLGVSKNRQYIEFQDVSAANMGYEGTTFAALYSSK